MNGMDEPETGWLRYPLPMLLGDGARAGLGLLVCLIPFLFTRPVAWVGWVLAAAALLFLLFGLRTALRAASRWRLDADGLVLHGPIRRRLRWDGLSALKLRYYSTKRNRSGGWFVLNLTGVAGRMQLESPLPAFEVIAARAFEAARARGLTLDPVTEDNLAALGLHREGKDQGLA